MIDPIDKQETNDEILKKILSELAMIKKEVSELKRKIDVIYDSNSFIKESSEKMANHIDFVENVYDRIRKPFNYLINTVSRYNVELEDTKNSRNQGVKIEVLE